MSIKQRSDVRIISGSKRGSKIYFGAQPGLRPSGDRVREMLFSWLQSDIAGCRCLDMFAGSGALGFEAASRGAIEVVLLENNRETVDVLKENCQRLKFGNVTVVAGDAGEEKTYENALFANNGFDLVFIDPPFADNLHQQSIDLVQNSALLNMGATIYIESDKQLLELVVPDNWQLFRDKVAGRVRARLYRAIAAD